MSEVYGVGGSSEPQTLQSAARDNAELDKTQFLSLLIAQLKNQDPMNPVQNQDFIAQLATFSSLEQMISVNEGVGQLTEIAATAALAMVDQLNSIQSGLAQIAKALGAETEEDDEAGDAAAGGDAAGDAATGTEG